jgi:hypothetical protein
MSGTSSPKSWRRTIAIIAAGALLPIGITAFSTNASAITGGPDAPQTLPATPTATWQTNNAVWSTIVRNHVLWVGGDFTKIRPPGVATGGAGEIAMTRLAAFNADGPNAGQPCVAATPCVGIGVWNDPKVSGRVYALNTTPDGNRLYAGGDLTVAGGKAHVKAVAFDITPGVVATKRLLAWNPGFAGGTVRAIASTSNAVYFGGAFTSALDPTATAQPRDGVAAFDPNGALLGWQPALDGVVNALLVAPNNTGELVLGGGFRTVNGAPHSGVAQVDLATGTVDGPMSNDIVPTYAAPNHSDVKALTTDGTSIYLGAEGSGPSVYDGTASIDPTTGLPNWRNTCQGATQAIAFLKGALYDGSHMHDCSLNPQGGGFPQDPFQAGAASWHHLTALQAVADPAVPNSGGQLLTWYASVNPGPTNGATPNELGPRAMDTDGTNLFVGGQFTTANGKPQQGLVMYTPGPDTTAPAKPAVSATSAAPGSATVRWLGSSDADDTNLTYAVYKDGSTTPSYTTGPLVSHWWFSPSFVWRDTDASVGTHTYAVTVTDESGLSSSRSVSVTVPLAVTGGYAAKVLADGASQYWRLDEPAGTVAADSSNHGATGTYRGNYVKNVAGVLPSDAAVTEPNTTTTSISSNAAATAPPANFSLELWFRSTAANGGRLIGWSNVASGTSASPDRTLYMTNTGQLIYAERNANGSTCQGGSNKYWATGICYGWTQQQYNDGTWHHVVVTQSATTGLVVYVDGAAQSSQPTGTTPTTAAGLWRVGADNLSPFPRKPGGQALAGDIDEVAVYPTALSAAQVAAHHAAAE